MSVKPNPQTTSAQDNQVPPELRQFVRENGVGVHRISRCSNENETHSRGWVVVCNYLMLTHKIPDGYGVAAIAPDAETDSIRVQIREEL